MPPTATAARDLLHLSTGQIGAFPLVGSVGSLGAVTASGAVVQRRRDCRTLLVATGAMLRVSGTASFVGLLAFGLMPTPPVATRGHAVWGLGAALAVEPAAALPTTGAVPMPAPPLAAPADEPLSVGPDTLVPSPSRQDRR